jgi:hypothetical protein
VLAPSEIPSGTTGTDRESEMAEILVSAGGAASFGRCRPAFVISAVSDSF